MNPRATCSRLPGPVTPCPRPWIPGDQNQSALIILARTAFDSLHHPTVESLTSESFPSLSGLLLSPEEVTGVRTSVSCGVPRDARLFVGVTMPGIVDPGLRPERWCGVSPASRRSSSSSSSSLEKRESGITEKRKMELSLAGRLKIVHARDTDRASFTFNPISSTPNPFPSRVQNRDVD